MENYYDDFDAQEYLVLKARALEILTEMALFRDCLMAELLRKYDPNQLRVPADNSDGGQWTSGGNGNGNAVKPAKPLYEPKADDDFLLGVKLFGAPAKSNLDEHFELIKRAAQFYKVDQNLIRGIIINESSTRLGGGVFESILSKINELTGGYGTYGPAQLGPDARAILDLDPIDVISYEGAIIGAANFLNIQRQRLILEGVKNPTNGQIASRYNWDNWPIDQPITKYGIRVEYLIERFYSGNDK